MNKFEISDTECNFDRITDYAVSRDDTVAVGANQYLNIYHNDGSFLYSYWLEGISSAYTLEFSDKDILIYKIRKEESILLHPDGSYLSVDSANHKENSRSSQTINQIDYQINSTLTELTATDQSGNTRIIYQMSASAQQQDLLLTMLIVVTAAACLVKIFRKKPSA